MLWIRPIRIHLCKTNEQLLPTCFNEGIALEISLIEQRISLSDNVKNFTWKQILMRSFLMQSGKLMMKRLPRSSRISSGIEWWRYSCPILNWILLTRTRFSDVVRASFFSFWSNCFVFFIKKFSVTEPFITNLGKCCSKISDFKKLPPFLDFVKFVASVSLSQNHLGLSKCRMFLHISAIVLIHFLGMSTSKTVVFECFF